MLPVAIFVYLFYNININLKISNIQIFIPNVTYRFKSWQKSPLSKSNFKMNCKNIQNLLYYLYGFFFNDLYLAFQVCD